MNIRNAKKFRRTLAALVSAVYFLLTLHVPTVLMQGSVNQDAWIQYYDKPKECLFPESIKEFSKCLSYRDEEAKKFDMEWTANHKKKN